MCIKCFNSRKSKDKNLTHRTSKKPKNIERKIEGNNKDESTNERLQANSLKLKFGPLKSLSDKIDRCVAECVHERAREGESVCTWERELQRTDKQHWGQKS